MDQHIAYKQMLHSFSAFLVEGRALQEEGEVG